MEAGGGGDVSLGLGELGRPAEGVGGGGGGGEEAAGEHRFVCLFV